MIWLPFTIIQWRSDISLFYRQKYRTKRLSDSQNVTLLLSHWPWPHIKFFPNLFFSNGFVFLWFSSENSLYIVDNNPLSGMCFATILPHCGVWLSIHLTELCTQKNFLILIKSRLSIFFFYGLCFGVIIKHFLLRSMS